MHKFKKLMQKAAEKELSKDKMLALTDVIGDAVHELPDDTKDEMYFELDLIICGDELSREDAEHYVSGMYNEDGSEGEHWSYDEVDKYLRNKSSHAHSTEKIYVVMNMLRSDYYPTIENLTSDVTKQTESYYQMACKFLDDDDAKPHKLKRYMHFISE